MMKTKIGTIAAICLLGACGTAQQEPCEAARDHVQACFPEQDARILDSCDEAQAEALLAKDCDALAADAESQAGAADGFCNPFFWWTCGGGGDTEPDPTGYSFGLNVSICESDLCVEDLFGENESGVECGKMTMHDANGDVVAVDYLDDHLTWGGVMDTGPGFSDLDLPAGDYTVRLWRTDGELAADIDEGTAEITVSLLPDGGVEKSRSRFRLLATEAESVRACSDVQGTLASTCDGEPMEKEDIEYGWLIGIQGTNAEGSYENLKRNGFVFSLQGHSYLFPKVRAGRYTVTYHEVDVSSWNRDDLRNAKYDELVEALDRYGTGVAFEQSVDISDSEVAASDVVQLPHVDLESELCL